jgi:hypothetical protein
MSNSRLTDRPARPVAGIGQGLRLGIEERERAFAATLAVLLVHFVAARVGDVSTLTRTKYRPTSPRNIGPW